MSDSRRDAAGVQPPTAPLTNWKHAAYDAVRDQIIVKVGRRYHRVAAAFLVLSLLAGCAVAPQGHHDRLTPAEEFKGEKTSWNGWLVATAFRPMVSDGCATPLDRANALLKELERRIITPGPSGFTPACKAFAMRSAHNLIVDAGKTALRDCLNNNTNTRCSNALPTWKFHGLGVSSTAAAAGDTGCTTELTTQYNPDSTRATGTQTTSTGISYQTVGTNSVDAGATITEFCLMVSATGAGTPMFAHVVFPGIALNAADSLQTTYTVTF